jgi:hypothetical protein
VWVEDEVTACSGGGSPLGKGQEWHDTSTLAGLPLRYRKYLRSNQVSLPDFRKLSDPHPIAKPLTGFVHSRAEKNTGTDLPGEWVLIGFLLTKAKLDGDMLSFYSMWQTPEGLGKPW